MNPPCWPKKLSQLTIMETRLRKLIELRPEAQAYNALGYSLADRNLRLLEARALTEQALKLSPEDFFILDSRLGAVSPRRPRRCIGLSHQGLRGAVTIPKWRRISGKCWG